MNYTEKYHLPQWEETDRIMRTDFNQMCADLESGLTAAQAKADGAYSPEYSPVAVGTYVGTGRERQTIVTGFRPRAVIITGQTFDVSSEAAKTILIGGPDIMSPMLQLLDNGFSIGFGYTGTSNPIYPRMNTEGKTYIYMAFR